MRSGSDGSCVRRTGWGGRIGLGLILWLALSPLEAQLTEYPLPNYESLALDGISSGPDGALWFAQLGSSQIGRITTAGSITGYPTLTAQSSPTEITAGPDGALWFTEAGVGKIGRITTAGVITEYALPDPASQPHGIAAGPDGALWFTEYASAKIGRITTSGAISEYATPTAKSTPWGIAAGPDGALWFTEPAVSQIGRIGGDGSIVEYMTTTAGSSPIGIAAGPDGALWFAEEEADQIGRISTAGSVMEYPLPALSRPVEIAAGPDGALWFTEVILSSVGRITTAGAASTVVAHVSVEGGITNGPDGALWFTESGPGGDKIGRFSPGVATPAITSISPTGATGGGPAFPLTVNGSGFATGAQVEWNSSPLQSTLVSTTQLTAQIPAVLIEQAGTAGIAVVSNGVTSNVVPFTISPGPAIASLSPSSVTAGGAAFALTVNGSEFASNAVVDWNGSGLPTTFINSNQLTASVSAELIATPGMPEITVVSGGLTSAPATYVITAPPGVVSLSPFSATVGGPGFTLSVTGDGFSAGAAVNWNGSPLPTVYVNGALLTALVPGSLLNTAGTALVTVTSGGAASNGAIFIVAHLSIQSMNPPSVPEGGPAFTLTVNGSGFEPGAVVSWNGAALVTSVLNSMEATASVPASLYATAGTASIQVLLSFGASAQASFTVAPALNPPCANIAGAWNWSESGSYTQTISATVETDTEKYPVSGNGTILITQTGCSISYEPVGLSGLIGLNLSPGELAAVLRTGSVSGNGVSVSGLLALIDVAGGAQAGQFATGVSGNLLTAMGQVSGNTITLNSTGNAAISGTYYINGQSGAFTETVTASSTATLTRIVGPAITSVTVASGDSGTAQNTWIAIKGVNLTPVTTPPGGVDWDTAPDFAQGKMPTQLDGVSVTVNGKSGFLYFYCSAATSTVCASDQINVLAPLDQATGFVDVVVTNNGTSSPPYSVNMAPILRAFLQFGASSYAAATHSDGDLIGPSSLYPGASTPAQPGEEIVVYGVGFGLPAGTALVNGSSSQSGSLVPIPVCQMGPNMAAVQFAGLISPGLYQLNITIPAGIPTGDNPLSCTYQGATTTPGALITLQ